MSFLHIVISCLCTHYFLSSWSVNEITPDIVQVKRAHPVMTKFERLLVRLKAHDASSY